MIEHSAPKQNFNVLAIVIIVLSSVIIVLGFILDSWYYKGQLLCGAGPNRRSRWVFDGTYQLQRLA